MSHTQALVPIHVCVTVLPKQLQCGCANIALVQDLHSGMVLAKNYPLLKGL